VKGRQNEKVADIEFDRVVSSSHFVRPNSPIKDVEDIRVEEVRTIDGTLLGSAWAHLQNSREDKFFRNNSFDCYYFRQAKFDGKDIIYVNGKRVSPPGCSNPPSYNIIFNDNGNVSVCSLVVKFTATPCLK